jgi:rhodanese-related sulfurtransferase
MELAIAKEICPTTTLGKAKEGALIVDVREIDEINQFSFDVPNYLAIPLSQFEERFIEIPKNQDLVIVCHSGARSLKATYYLMNHGYPSVANMSGGILKWHAKGFPTIGKPEPEHAASSGCCGSPAVSAVESSCCGDTSDKSELKSSCC